MISPDTALITAENIMMSNINKGNKRITFVKPDYPDIHINAEFKHRQFPANVLPEEKDARDFL